MQHRLSEGHEPTTAHWWTMSASCIQIVRLCPGTKKKQKTKNKTKQKKQKQKQKVKKKEEKPGRRERVEQERYITN